jgi:Holliday junction resolvasome RuvABC endonuclease subunit
MVSDAAAPVKLDIQIPVNGYADDIYDMALISNSHAEAQQILSMLNRVLAYYSMELNPAK